MNYKNFLIVASKKDTAGINITTQLSQFGNFKFYLVDDEIIFDENLDMEKINSYDFVIFVSKHKSESNDKSLCVHVPGNWNFAEFGGKTKKVCKSSALFFKKIFENLNKNFSKNPLNGFKVTLEVTHHGPLIDKPCIFIEIGSTEREWGDKKAGFLIAKTIFETISDFQENPYNEIALAIGGPHYCPSFNKIQSNSNIAISHIIPQYAIPITEEMIKQAIEKTEEEVDMILLDWKGLGKSEKRKDILDVLNKFFIPIKKTSEIKK